MSRGASSEFEVAGSCLALYGGMFGTSIPYEKVTPEKVHFRLFDDFGVNFPGS